MARLLQWLPLVLLLTGTTAAAQPLPPVREQQQRQVVVPSGPNEPVPEVRVAAKVATYFRFNDTIDRASVELEGGPARFRWVDKGDRLVALELMIDLGAEEKLAMRVRYKEGAGPTYATFALVSHPTLVDKEVEVVRHPRTPELLEAALAPCEASGPARLVLSGQLDREGVRAKEFQGTVPPENQSGLTAWGGTGYRAPRWVVVAIYVRNLPGQKPWAPASARLFSAGGGAVRVRLVQLREKQLQPGESGLVVVEADALTSGNGPFRLELVDMEGGRLLPIQGVKF